MSAAWYLALRFLREGRAQTVLIVAGVAVGIGVMVFVSSLITGLQKTIIARTLGTQASIVVSPPEEVARELLQAREPEGVVVVGRVEKRAQRVRSIDQWQRIAKDVDGIPGVTAVSPMASGAAFAVRGTASRSIALIGVEPESYERIVPIGDHLVRGRYELGGTDAVIGTELADDLGVDLGGRIRITTASGRAAMFTVRGVFDLGIRDLNERWVIVSLRNGQTLLDLMGGASTLSVKTADVFEADRIADLIEARTSLKVESWMDRNAELMVALRSQNASSLIIRLFVMLAVAMGIASVLVVSVVQKSRQIGILRAMGAPRRMVLRIFLIQGGVVGVVGAVAGAGLGALLSALFATVARGTTGEELFPIAVDLPLFLAAVAIAAVTGITAAWLPARRASRLDPAVAIHHE